MKTAKERIERIIQKWTDWIEEAEKRGDEAAAIRYCIYRMGMEAALDIVKDYDEGGGK